MSSVACLGSLEALDAGPAGDEKPLYLFKSVDASVRRTAIRDVRAIFRQQLGDRLLPFCCVEAPW